MRLDPGNLDAFARGCAVLGTGGGGDTRTSLLAALAATAAHGPVEVVSLDDLDDDALVLPVAGWGAPTVGIEKFESGEEGRALRDAAERWFGRPVAALMPGEIGGGNGVQPVAWAAELGLPLADADAMGRAFPEGDMASMHVLGVSPSPAFFADERGNVVTATPPDALWLERIAAAPRDGVRRHRRRGRPRDDRGGRPRRDGARHRLARVADRRGAGRGGGGRRARRHGWPPPRHRQGRRRRAPHDGWVRTRRGHGGRHGHGPRADGADRRPEREPACHRGRADAGVGARPDPDPRRGDRRGRAHRARPLRPARRGRGAPRGAGVAHAPRARGRRSRTVRLPGPVRRRSRTAADDAPDRHRRRAAPTPTRCSIDDDDRVLAAREDPDHRGSLARGSSAALAAVLPDDGAPVGWVALGTTHALNALLRRRDLGRVAVLRIGAPATRSVPPFAGWPDDLRDAIDAGTADRRRRRGGRRTHAPGRPRRDPHAPSRRRCPSTRSRSPGRSPCRTPRRSSRPSGRSPAWPATSPISLGHERRRARAPRARERRDRERALRAVAEPRDRRVRAGARGARPRATPFLSQNDGTMMGVDRAPDAPRPHDRRRPVELDPRRRRADRPRRRARDRRGRDEHRRRRDRAGVPAGVRRGRGDRRRPHELPDARRGVRGRGRRHQDRRRRRPRTRQRRPPAHDRGARLRRTGRRPCRTPRSRPAARRWAIPDGSAVGRGRTRSCRPTDGSPTRSTG